MPAGPERGWSTPEGHDLIRRILVDALPQWPSGPHDWQVESTAHILDNQSQLVVAACGDGKTAAAYLHLLVLQKLAADPTLPRYGKRVPERPVVLMVTPLSDLGRNQVCSQHAEDIYKGYSPPQADSMNKTGVRAIALDTRSIEKARDNNIDLHKEVRQCLWSVTIVSPERLTTPEFDKIVRDPTWRSSLVLYVGDEAHIINIWARTFRDAYADIGRVSARIPPDVPILALTATSIPGKIEAAMLRTLGFRSGYAVIRRTCERPNLQMVFCTLSHGLGSWEFPDIAWVTRKLKKTVIYISTIEQGFRLATYLWKLLPRGSSRFRVVQLYNGLIDDDDNAETLRAFSDDSGARIMIATVKFGMGIDIKNIEVSINLGLPESAEAILQQNGRAGRNQDIEASGFTYIQKSLVSAVAAELRGNGPKLRNGARGKALMKTNPGIDEDDDRVASRIEDPHLRRLVVAHIQKRCLVAEANILFGSPGSTSHEHCLTAQRRLPCSSCLDREPVYQELAKATMPQPPPAYPANTSNVSTPSHQHDHLDEDDAPPAFETGIVHTKLTKDMRARAQEAIHLFCRQQWLARQPRTARDMYLPSVSYIPSDMQSALLTHFHFLRDREALAGILFDWEYLEQDGYKLFKIIKDLNIVFDQEHETKKAETKAKAAETRRRSAAAAKAAKAAGDGGDKQVTLRGDADPARIDSMEHGE